MEEKERYDVKRLSYSLNVKLTDNYEPDWRYIIFDDVNDAELDKLETVCNLLNQQDKKIHILNEQSQNNYEKYTQVLKENQQLKQQLEEKEKRIHEVENTFNVSSIALADKFKKIKELKQQLAESERKLEEYKKCNCKECMTDYEKNLNQIIDKYLNENIKLKQQLHDLPNKIVEDFYDEIRHRAILEDDYCPDHNLERKYGVRKCLLEDIRTTILKKYGGEDESN